MRMIQRQVLRADASCGSGNGAEDSVLIELLVTQMVGPVKKVSIGELMVKANVTLVIVIAARLIRDVVINDLIGNCGQRSHCQQFDSHRIYPAFWNNAARKSATHAVGKGIRVIDRDSVVT